MRCKPSLTGTTTMAINQYIASHRMRSLLLGGRCSAWAGLKSPKSQVISPGVGSTFDSTSQIWKAKLAIWVRNIFTIITQRIESWPRSQDFARTCGKVASTNASIKFRLFSLAVTTYQTLSSAKTSKSTSTEPPVCLWSGSSLVTSSQSSNTWTNFTQISQRGAPKCKAQKFWSRNWSKNVRNSTST